MLIVGGEDALSGLQNITIVAALPFLVVMVGLAISLVKDLNADPLIVRRQIAVAAIDQAVVAGVTEHGDDFALVVEEARPRTPLRATPVLTPCRTGTPTATGARMLPTVRPLPPGSAPDSGRCAAWRPSRPILGPMRIGVFGATDRSARSCCPPRGARLPVDDIRYFASARSAGTTLPWAGGR